MKRGKHVLNCKRGLPGKQHTFHPHFSFTWNTAALFSCFKPQLHPLWHFSFQNKTEAHFIPLERLIYWLLRISRCFFVLFGPGTRVSGGGEGKEWLQESGYDENSPKLPTVRRKRSAAAEHRSANIPHVAPNPKQTEPGLKVVKVFGFKVCPSPTVVFFFFFFNFSPPRSWRLAEARMGRVWKREAVMSER